VSDLAGAQGAPNSGDDVVARQARRLVDKQESIRSCHRRKECITGAWRA
jgi:hypothetical protein